MVYTAEAAITAAKGQVGYRESGENDTRFNRWLGRIDGYGAGGYGYPWCASFQAWCADKAGGRANTDYPRTAGCAVAVQWFKAHGRWSSTPHVGDWVFYGPGGATHVELVTSVSAGSYRAIGGNTSGSLSGQYFNGDGVYAKTVSRSESRIYGYGRPIYQEDDMPLTKEDIEAVAAAVWKHNIGASWVPKGSDNQWQASTHVGVMHAHVRNAEALVAKLASQAPDVDEAAIVQGILAGLAPDKVAAAVVAALPADLARQVVDEIQGRLAE